MQNNILLLSGTPNAIDQSLVWTKWQELFAGWIPLIFVVSLGRMVAFASPFFSYSFACRKSPRHKTKFWSYIFHMLHIFLVFYLNLKSKKSCTKNIIVSFVYRPPPHGLHWNDFLGLFYDTWYYDGRLLTLWRKKIAETFLL